MNELIKVDFSKERPAVSARELHEFLGVGTKFQDWFPRMKEYGFTEGQDFETVKIENVLSQKRERTYSMTDYALSIDMAKEICMLQRNEKGKQARQYFLQLEKDWNSPEKVMARALQIADREIKRLEAENEQQKQAIADFQPIKRYVDTILGSKASLATSQVAADYDLTANKLNKILHEEGIQHNVNGQWILYRKHMGQGYTKSKTISFVRSNGEHDTKLHTQWTQKGRMMIHEILERRGIKAVMDCTAS